MLRWAAFLAFVGGLIAQLYDFPASNAILLVAGGLMVLALICYLVAGGWAESHGDEKLRLTGHMLILYGSASFLTWLWKLPFGWPAIGTGIFLFLLATFLRRRRLKEETLTENRIEEIGKSA